MNHRFIDLAQINQGAPQVHMRFHKFRVYLQRFLKAGNCFVDFSHTDQGNAQLLDASTN